MSVRGPEPGGPRDPLRTARRAVTAGHFRDAWGELGRLSGAVRDTAEWLLLAAVASWRLGEFARSRAAALQARDRYRAIGDIDGEMRAVNVAAAGAFAVGDLGDAVHGFNRAMTLADRARNDLTTARCANNLGNVEYYHARYVRALGYYRLAIASFEKLSSWNGLAEGWLNTAIVWREYGDPAASRTAAERAVTSAERAGNDRLFGQALAASGETAAALGDLDLARAQVERALEIARSQHDPLGESDALRILAVIAGARDEYERAMRLAAEALAIAGDVDHPWAAAEVQRTLGDVLRAAGRPDRAARAYEAAAAGYVRVGAHERADEMRARAAAPDG